MGSPSRGCRDGNYFGAYPGRHHKDLTIALLTRSLQKWAEVVREKGLAPKPIPRRAKRLWKGGRCRGPGGRELRARAPPSFSSDGPGLVTGTLVDHGPSPNKPIRGAAIALRRAWPPG